MKPPSRDNHPNQLAPDDDDEDYKLLLADLDPESPGFAERHPEVHQLIEEANKGIKRLPPTEHLDDDIPF